MYNNKNNKVMKMSYRPHAFDNQCIAEITVKKNSIKKYNSDYYLKNSQEFEILLRNNTQDVVMATIKINGKQISTSGLVLKPGQKVYLERYLDQNRKFIFETYKVDNATESLRAIENNGNIEVQFYREKQPEPVVYYTQPYYEQPYNLNQPFGFITSSSTYFSGTPSYGGQQVNSLKSRRTDKSQISLDAMDLMGEVETGRVGQGSVSNQDFTDYNGQFESYSFKTISLKILPYSLKPVELKDLAEYCTRCGLKNRKGNYKFCPKCGNRFN